MHDKCLLQCQALPGVQYVVSFFARVNEPGSEKGCGLRAELETASPTSFCGQSRYLAP